MSFRTRVLAACLVAAVVPLAVLTLGIRQEVERRLTAQYRQRVDALVSVIREDLDRQGRAVDDRLAALAGALEGNARVRAAVLLGEERTEVLDWAGREMSLAGLDYLVLLDGAGRILSSGHFRNEYDRVASGLASLLGGTSGSVLVRARTAEGSLLALARARAFEMGGRPFALAGGVAVDRAFLERLARGERTGGIAVALVAPEAEPGAGSTARDAGAMTSELPLPWLDDTGGSIPALDTARVAVAHSLAPLAALQRRMDLWFVGGLATALVLAVVIAQVVSARVTRPLTELAAKTRRLDLDRLDVDFRSRRRDEVGSLARLMAAMVDRLRAGAAQLRQAERRATVGDMARQVNHDIRNGLLPIRNVIRHLTDVARENPAELAPVFAERQATLDGAVAYLESLATTYARLSPRADRRPTDVNGVVRAVVRGASVPAGATLREALDPSLPRVAADPVPLRRVLENLVVNALESLEGGGSVTVATSAEGGPRGPTVAITVSDTGRGMDAEQVEHAFEDFFTTKREGTGLGLSIVRRLVADLGGRVAVESTPGRGTRFRVELPALEDSTVASTTSREAT